MVHLETDCENNFRDLKHWDSWSVGCRARSITFQHTNANSSEGEAQFVYF